jgi:squalene-hopene/tetraprenyl-beta-curcumene cyclase
MNVPSMAFRLQYSAPTLTAVRDLSEQISAIVRTARRQLLERQEADGCWRFCRPSNGAAEAEALFMLAFLNRPNDPRRPGLVKSLLAEQRADGGWARDAGKSSEADDSVFAYFALRLAGCEAESPPLRRCRDRLLAFGRGAPISPRTRFFLALFGQCPHAGDWSDLLTGSLVEEWALQILNSYKPVQPCPRDPAIAPFLSHEPLGSPSLSWTPMRSWNGRKAAQQLRDHFSDESAAEPDGPTTALPLMALHCLRLPDTSADVIEAWRQFDSRCVWDGERLRVALALTPQRDTAQAMLALLECGTPAQSPEIQQAGAWLWRWLARGQARGDRTVDELAWALLALARSGVAFQSDHSLLVEHAIDSLLDAQADDGSWGSPEITGLELEALGEFGLDLGDECVADAIAHLERVQKAEGGWRDAIDAQGAYETFRILSGLRAVKFDPRSAMVRRAAAWLKRNRNHIDEATPANAAWIVLGLIAGGEATAVEVDLGVNRLIESRLDEAVADHSFDPVYSLAAPMIALSRFHRQRFGESRSF